MQLLNMLNIILIILVFVIVILVGIYILIIYKSKYSIKKEEKGKSDGIQINKDTVNNFMEFDEIKDNMIIRKEKKQYVMVIQCQGINYDLLSEEEKVSVEEGFVQFLNTLRFPIQFYVQTSSLNLKDITEDYKNRIKSMEKEIEKIKNKIKETENKGDTKTLEKLKFEKKRKENILEYGSDISNYIGRLSLNKNVLQQKSYIVVSYYSSELGDLNQYGQEDIDNLCFSEIYTRVQSVIRSLAASEVTGRILESEELAELLYVAYNRDDSEILQLNKVLDSEYDSLYSTAPDILLKRQQLLDETIENEAIELATQSILDADAMRKEAEANKKEKIKKKALGIIEDYKNQMDDDIYNISKKQIENYSKKNEKFLKN